jgi:hypothetical protein
MSSKSVSNTRNGRKGIVSIRVLRRHQKMFGFNDRLLTPLFVSGCTEDTLGEGYASLPHTPCEPRTVTGYERHNGRHARSVP